MIVLIQCARICKFLKYVDSGIHFNSTGGHIRWTTHYNEKNSVTRQPPGCMSIWRFPSGLDSFPPHPNPSPPLPHPILPMASLVTPPLPLDLPMPPLPTSHPSHPTVPSPLPIPKSLHSYHHIWSRIFNHSEGTSANWSIPRIDN